MLNYQRVSHSSLLTMTGRADQLSGASLEALLNPLKAMGFSEG